MQLPRILSILACVFAFAVWADDPTTTLRIEVKDLKNKPIERAAVIVTFSEGRSIMKFGKKDTTTWEMRTNQEGVAKIPPIPQGEVLIRVISKKHQTFGQTYDLKEEQETILVKLNPPQPQYSAH